MVESDSTRGRLDRLLDTDALSASVVAMLALTAAAVGYEVGSVLAGDAFDPAWVVMIVGLAVANVALWYSEREG